MGDNQGNLMDFGDEEDNRRSSDSGNSMSWMSILAELEFGLSIGSSNSTATTTTTTSVPVTSTGSNPSVSNASSLYNPFGAVGRQEFINPGYNPFAKETPGELFLNSLLESNSSPIDPSGVSSLRSCHSEESLSPTHSVNTNSNGTGDLSSGIMSSTRSLTPPPLPAKINRFGHFNAELFNASAGRNTQSPLPENLDSSQGAGCVNDMNWKSADEYGGMDKSFDSRTASVGSTDSYHPYDSIALRRNFSVRSMRSTDSDGSTERYLQVKGEKPSTVAELKKETIENKDLSTESHFDSATDTFGQEQQPLQVKLPDLETEEREFFGHNSMASTPHNYSTLPTPKNIEAYKYSVTDQSRASQTLPKSQKSSSTGIVSPSLKESIPGGGLFEVAKERNLEVVAFGQVLSDLRSNFPWKEFTNRGYVLSPALPPSFGEEAYDLDTETPVVIYTESRTDTIRFIINVHRPVREVIELAISCLSDSVLDATDTGICNAFLLKVCGKSEYLEAERELVDYECIQQCLKLQLEVQFVLVETDRVSRALMRSAEDDNYDLIPRNYKEFFDVTNSTAISEYGLTVLMGAFSDEVAKVLQETTNLVAPRFEPSRIIQSVKAICAMLANIETSEIHSAVDALNELYHQKDAPDGHPKAPDSDSIGRILTRLNDSVLMLVEMYCEAFDTDFTASQIHRPGLSGTVEVTAMSENLRIRVASAHRLPLNWKQDYEHFQVQAGVYYGGALLCLVGMTPLTTITKKFLDHLRWDEWLEFQIQVRQLPRESRLCVTLYGYTSITKGTAVHTPRVPLGWVGMQLFNFNGVLASGTQLLGLWPDAKSNPVGACTSNLLHPASVLMLVEFERYLAEIIFPECDVLPGIDEANMSIPDADYGVYEEILEKDLFNELKPDEKIILWQHRYYCRKVSRALPLVLSCVESWEYKHLADIYQLLEVWTPMFPVDAMELLKVNFPDCKVRAMAVRWMGNFSDDELCDYLPQLVQALKYEIYHDSPLASFLIRRALGNVRLMHALFWYLKDKINDPQFGERFQVILGGILSICGEAQRDEFTFEDELVAEMIKIAQKVKNAPNSSRTNILQQELAALSGSLPCIFRLPLTPSMEVVGMDVRSCGYFTSNSAPLRLVFNNSDPFGDNTNVIFKMGDDMRQDTLTMQLVGIMNKIWFREGLDLKIITYQCMALGPGIGMIEIVNDAQTLREIHTEFGVTGSFKDEPISRWLLKHNPDEKAYRSAVYNFTASCAGYCVATYVLGICDRHNDNIMIRKSGHLFHIDFAKILGHAQMFGTFRRDRAPFVLTPDMAYVINGGYQPSSRFQDFVDLCCKAFNLIRRHANLFLNLLSLMLNSGISSLSSVHDLKYIRDSLLPNASEADATATFTRLIHSSLTSWFTQVNFFIHNVAQLREVGMKRSSSSNRNSVLSFAPKTHNVDSDGFIESARVVDFQKRHTPAEKYYIYVINICRVTNEKPSFVFRRFCHFQELHAKLMELFPEAVLPRLPARIYLGRSQIRTVAERRRAELDDYLRHLLMLPSEIAECNALYTFLHPLLLDEEEASKFSIQLLPEEKADRAITGQIKLSLRFERESLRVMIMHAKDLSPRGTSGLADPYVKLYLLPDPEKVTKIKTKVAKRTLNPTYNETLVYNNRPRTELDGRQLQVTVWDHDRVGENEYVGGVLIDLAKVDLTVTSTQWYDLVDLRK